ncbi:Hypothetical predicted protein [Prunus dulcis]|uniref:Uncharacterized protein n=1 Tax=Prunus dulcis TaxID=3755 RepID=A0A5E4EN06_PRUDU|nr:Hypothetical predicted protein [Prunus dulcis]
MPKCRIFSRFNEFPYQQHAKVQNGNGSGAKQNERFSFTKGKPEVFLMNANLGPHPYTSSELPLPLIPLRMWYQPSNPRPLGVSASTLWLLVLSA